MQSVWHQSAKFKDRNLLLYRGIINAALING